MKNKKIRGVLQFINTDTEENFYIPLSIIKYIKTTSNRVVVYIEGRDAPITIESSTHNVGAMYEWITFNGEIV